MGLPSTVRSMNQRRAFDAQRTAYGYWQGKGRLGAARAAWRPQRGLLRLSSGP